MKLVFVRVRSEPTAPGDNTAGSTVTPPRTGSSSKNLILALQQHGLVSSVEEWQFVNGNGSLPNEPGRLPARVFSADPERLGSSVARHVESAGRPDILWIEGTAHPPYLAALFQLQPASFKIVYSKHWEPWIVQRLDCFDLCLVDDEHQIAAVHRCYPSVTCGVWDKLLDYENVHRPTRCDKIYDVCYVAYLRPRKNHELLFRSLAKLGGRRPSCVCVGDDRKGNRAALEQLAADLNLQVHFTGDVPADEVNRYINRSRIGVMCSRRDAAPRAILEYMAADVPVLVNSHLLAGARYVGPGAGIVRAPDQFHLGIAELLENLDRYRPRANYLADFSLKQVVGRFVRTLRAAGLDLCAPDCTLDWLRTVDTRQS